MKPVTDYEKIKDLLFNSDKNLFITGPGGTGKTYLINSYLATATNAIVCGTTGMAAANIGGIRCIGSLQFQYQHVEPT